MILEELYELEYWKLGSIVLLLKQLVKFIGSYVYRITLATCIRVLARHSFLQYYKIMYITMYMCILISVITREHIYLVMDV